MDREITDQRVKIGDFSGQPRRAPGGLAWPIREEVKTLKEGDTIKFVVEVSDNRSGSAGPNLGRSRARTISIVSEGEFLMYVLEQKRRVLSRLRGIHEQETEAAEAVGDLKLGRPQEPPKYD